ncbi:MAG: GNAT family N-acetyltransferase [Opitutaceae bacterium]
MAPAHQTSVDLGVKSGAAASSAVRQEALDSATAKRKLTFLQRSGLFGGETKGAVIERALKLEDLRRAYRLVHQVYLGTGFLNPEPSGLRLRIYETTSETATFVAKKDGEVVGVLSVVGDSIDLGLPSNSAFKAELDALRATGARVCEVTNQAVAEEYRKTGVATELMRCAIAHMMKSGYHFAVASVSPSHNGFYELMGFRRFGSQRSYSQKLHDPVVALCLNIDRYRNPPDELSEPEKFLHHLATDANPFLELVTGWSRQAVRHFLNPELLEQLFVADRNFLGECTPAELMILQRRWGQELFGAVTGTTYPPFSSGTPRPAAAAPGPAKEISSAGPPVKIPESYPSPADMVARRVHRLPQESSIRTALARRLSPRDVNANVS